MIYQCFVSSTTASGTASGVVSGARSAAASSTEVSSGSPAACVASSVCSSSSWRLSISGILLLHESCFSRNDGFLQNAIDDLEISGENKHAYYDHDRGRLHPFATRPGYPPHLAADVAEVSARTLDPVLLFFI